MPSMNNINDILTTTLTVVWNDNIKIITSAIMTMVIWIIAEKNLSVWILRSLPIKPRINDREIIKDENDFINKTNNYPEKKVNKTPSIPKTMIANSEQHIMSAQLENDYFQIKLKHKNK